MAPMTTEQLDFFTEQTRRAVRKVVKRAVVGYVFFVLALIVVFAVSQHNNGLQRQAIVQSGQVVSVSGCNRDFGTIQTLRSVLIASRSFQAAALKRGDITQAQFDRSVIYYDEQLTALQPPDCRNALDILTTDSDEVPPVPTPLFVARANEKRPG